MEIEYINELGIDFIGGGDSFFLVPCLIPLAFLFSYLKIKRSPTNLLLFVVLSGLSIAYVYDSIHSRFTKIAYQKDKVEVQNLYGETINISPKILKRFWSISIGKSRGRVCYLLIKTHGENYRSVTIRTRSRAYSCKQDADVLNDFYNK